MDLIFNKTNVYSDTKPEIITRYSDHRYVYKYDLKEEPLPSNEEKDDEDNHTIIQEGTLYSYVEVILKGYPNRNEVIKYLLRQLVSLEDELKIINDYNEVMQLDDNAVETEEYKTYIDYLYLRREIKNKVKEDFKNNGY